MEAVRHIKCPITHESSLRLKNHTCAKTPREKANAFANSLEKVFTSHDTNAHISPPNISNIVNVPINFHLDVKRSAGPDGITGLMIINLPTCAIRILLFILNAMLRIGYFPPSWIISTIVMIPKPGKEKSNYII